VTVQSLSWNTGAGVVNCTLRSDIDQDLTLIERSGIASMSTTAAVAPSPLGQMARVVHLQAGVSTDISIGLGQLNLALSRPVTASSGASSAAGAVDGNAGTAWTSAGTQSEWIYVDLGSVFSLTGAQVSWGATFGKSYNLQVSTDAVNWTNVFETPDGAGGVDRVTFSAPGRYVRMLGVQSSASGYSISEFQVFGNVTSLLPAAPANLTATAVSSSQINLSWSSGAGAGGYNVRQALAPGGPYTLVATNVPTLGFTNTGLSAGTIYYYSVTSTNAYGESTNAINGSAETVSTTVPQISLTLSNGLLGFNWPLDHVGWSLQAQTNPIGAGLGTNWAVLSGSTSTNRYFVPLNTANGSVFFRLSYP
jgi:hypothetical protein